MRLSRVIFSVAALSLVAGAASAETIRVGGTGSGLGTMERLGEAFTAENPDVFIEVVPGLGSGGGIKAVKAGDIEIGVAGRAPKDAEKAPNIVAMALARTPFVLVTSHPKPSGLASAQLPGLFESSSPAWPDGTPMNIILRPDGDSETKALIEAIPGIEPALAAARSRGTLPEGTNDQDAADLAEATEGSLVTSTLALVTSEGRNLRTIALDGVEPTLANLETGAYPHERPLYIVVRTDAEDVETVKKFVAFMASAEGQRIIREAGSIPLLSQPAM
jgi:phosphate transport system substrate-binding protein